MLHMFSKGHAISNEQSCHHALRMADFWHMSVHFIPNLTSKFQAIVELLILGPRPFLIIFT